MAGHRQAHRIGRDQPARGLDAGHAPAVAPDAGDFAMLDDVDAGGRGRARIAPGDRVVAHGAAAPLQKSAEHRVAPVIQVHQRHQRLDRLAAQCLGVHAEQPHQVGAPGKQIALRLGVEQVERAALADHGIEIQLALQPLPQLQRVVVEANIVRQEIIGADDGGVAPDVAEPDRALLQHRHIGDAVFGGQVIGGRQPMSAAADDHHAVARARRRLRPGARPAALAGEALEQQPPARIAAAGLALARPKQTAGGFLATPSSWLAIIKGIRPLPQAGRGGGDFNALAPCGNRQRAGAARTGPGGRHGGGRWRTF